MGASRCGLGGSRFIGMVTEVGVVAETEMTEISEMGAASAEVEIEASEVAAEGEMTAMLILSPTLTI